MTWATGRALPGNRWDLLDGLNPPSPPRVSVIVSHYRQPAQLARTLHALRRQDYPRDRLDLIVADDGSPEPPDVPPGVRLVRQADDGFRLAAVRNLGAAAANGEILVFLDADTTPEPSFVREIVRLPALAPECITVGRRRHADLAGIAATADIRVAAAERELAEPRWLADAYRASRNLLDADDRSYRHVIGAVLASSRKMFDEVGGFDETFTAYGGEDWEWAYRAWLRGGMLAHVPDAIAWHDGPDASARPGSLAAKNAEAMRLSELIPIPGSRAHGLRGEKVDIVVTGPPSPADEAQAFVSADSVVAALPRSEWLGSHGVTGFAGVGRLDRVRLSVEILRPVRVTGNAFAGQVERVGEDGIGELRLQDESGQDSIRIVSSRARARHLRWGRDDLFPHESVVCEGLRVLADRVDIEGYLGGWA